MFKKNFTFLLLLLILSNLVYVNVNVAAQDYIPRNVDIDRSGIPKNILVASYIGGRSLIKPMLDIAIILADRGYNVTLLTSGNYTPSSEYPNIKQVSLGPPFNPLSLKSLVDNINKEFDFTSLGKFRENLISSYKETYAKYEQFVKDNNIDLFFCDIIGNDACLDIAHALKKPIVGCFSHLFALVPKTYKSDPMFRCKISLENESFFERFRCTIIQPLRVLYHIYPYENRLNEIRKQIGVEPVFSSMKRLTETSLILVNTFLGFELPQTLPPNILEIGPILSDEYPSLTTELSHFMSRHERVLYVALGTRFITTTENNSKLLQSFVEAINGNIIDGVVWSLVQTSKENFTSTIDLTDGTQIQTAPILNNEHPHIRIVKFVPQFTILDHTNTKLFLSHGGASSSQESLYTGTPMLVLPLIGDQFSNSDKLKLSGVALTLNKFYLEVDDIVNKVEFLLKDENIKKNSKRMEILAKINSKRKYRAADLIEYILHNVGINEGVVDKEFLKEWLPADNRMGFIRSNNYDVYGALLGIVFGFVVGFLWIALKLIRLMIDDGSKQKME